MILSMTGYGDAQTSVAGISYALELRSLNSRYFKALIKLPENLQFFETEVEKLLRTRLGRGSVSCVLRMRTENATEYKINPGALQQYVNQICAVELPDDVHATLDLGSVAAMPGVCQAPILDDAQRQAYWEIVRGLTEEALEKLVVMRRAEGAALAEDLLGQCDRMREHLATIGGLTSRVMEEYVGRYRVRVQALINVGEVKVELDKDALAREVAIFADRCDITEELTRLACHLDQFGEFCRGKVHAGRKLDFLAQEMLREANTIGSKSNDAEISRNVVEIKGLIDRLKEQVQNVE